jgi:hypothetical protein
MKVAGLCYLSALAGALVLSAPALADPKADELSYVNAETHNMLAVDKWASDTHTMLKDTSRTSEEKLKSIQAENADFIKNLANMCRDDAQARKLEASIHQKFRQFSDIAVDITHGVNMSCSPDHRLRPTLWITKLTLRAVADTKFDERNDARNEEIWMRLVDKWATDTRNDLKAAGATDEEKLKKIQGKNKEFVTLVDREPCKDDAQAQKLEAYIHKKFHEFSDIAVDITHGVNMSCSPDHRLRPTLWITKFTLKLSP